MTEIAYAAGKEIVTPVRFRTIFFPIAIDAMDILLINKLRISGYVDIFVTRDLRCWKRKKLNALAMRE